jgi:ArsR family transcriptional regulator, arsenate/arsenite/antimonite-responsive transcriptional repressor
VLISAQRDATAVVGVLADPVRAQIVQVLARGPACVCHLVEDLDLKQPNVSNHIRVLRQAGLIRGENRGKFTFYHLNHAALDAAASFLAQLADTARANASAHRECA